MVRISTVTSKYYVTLLDELNKEIKKRRLHLKEKKFLFYEDSVLGHLFVKSMMKPTLFSRSDPQRLPFVPNLKRLLQEKKFHTNEEIISEMDTCFAEFDKSYYSRGMKML